MFYLCRPQGTSYRSAPRDLLQFGPKGPLTVGPRGFLTALTRAIRSGFGNRKLRTDTRFFGPAAQTARLMLYGLLAVVLMAMDQRGHYVPRIRSVAMNLIEPVYHVVEWPVRAARNVFGQLQSHRSLRHDNEALRQQLLSQQGALQRFAALIEENRRLRSLIEGAQGQTFEFQFAELVGVDLDPFSHKIIVNRGASDGVQSGQAVIDGAGVMGQVEDVRPHFSTIRLISDPNHALPVQINRTGLRTVAVEAMPLAALDRGREVLLIRTPEVIQEDKPDAEEEVIQEEKPEAEGAADGEGGE